MSLKPNLAVRCTQCRKHVTPIERATWYDADERDPDYAIQYVIGSCPHCGNTLLIKSQSNQEMDPMDGPFQWWQDPVLLYPTEDTELDASVPDSIAESYSEAAKCRSVDAHTATAIMCRRTLEGICAHYGTEGRNLATKLRALHEKGTIDKRIFEWADEVLKNLGNEAAHNVEETISAEDAGAALDFTKAIIEYLFVFSAAFDRFKERQEKRKKKKAPAEETTAN